MKHHIYEKSRHGKSHQPRDCCSMSLLLQQFYLFYILLAGFAMPPFLVPKSPQIITEEETFPDTSVRNDTINYSRRIFGNVGRKLGATLQKNTTQPQQFCKYMFRNMEYQYQTLIVESDILESKDYKKLLSQCFFPTHSCFNSSAQQKLSYLCICMLGINFFFENWLKYFCPSLFFTK